ncbi:MAG TPA: hypothetical protein VLM40_22225, partial [Gemmata sp.]|nr:hypothetical protein [Gemmata sp.]
MPVIAWEHLPGLAWAVLTFCPWMIARRSGTRWPVRGFVRITHREPTGLRKELPHEPRCAQ